jgi:hypothetical protein
MDLLLGSLVGLAAMAAVPGYFVLQWRFATRWSGGWRIAALAPLPVAAGLLVQALIAFAAESNLWPLLVILFAPLGCLWLLGLAAARRVAG